MLLVLTPLLNSVQWVLKKICLIFTSKVKYLYISAIINTYTLFSKFKLFNYCMFINTWFFCGADHTTKHQSIIPMNYSHVASLAVWWLWSTEQSNADSLLTDKFVWQLICFIFKEMVSHLICFSSLFSCLGKNDFSRDMRMYS